MYSLYSVDSNLKTIFLFVDGLGIGPDDPDINPLAVGRFPVLEKMIANAIPLDACLGVAGLPQSATGQTALLTGINAPKTMGRRGSRCTFANCYLNVDPNNLPSRRQSVTTVMTLAALGHVRGNADLDDGKAVCHDITRWTMHARGYEGPLITPEEAAEHLMTVAEEYDLTLFEHFLTDRAGHSGNLQQAFGQLETLERFVSTVAAFCDGPERLLIITSDHGNIEDLSVRTHTLNPVPLIVLGDRAAAFDACTSLCDVAPAIISLYGS